MSSRRAFTLLELVVTVVVLGLLAAIAIPTYQRITERAALTAETETLAAVGRNAAALAALDREAMPTAEHVATAFSELPSAAAPGVQAYNDAGTYRIYTQAEWFLSPTVPADKRAVILAVDEVLGLAGIAVVSDVDPTKCVMVRLSSLGSVESFTGDIEDLADCDGVLALAGPTEGAGGDGGDGGDGGPDPLGPEMIQPGIVLIGDGAANSGALDNVEITAGGDTFSDDFNRANGPLAAPWTTFQGVFPVPAITNNQVAGSTNAPAVALHSVPDGAATIAADVTAVPGSGQAAVHMIRMAEAGSEAQVQVGNDMQARVVVAVPGHPNTYMSTRSVPYQVGDRIELHRANSNEFTGLLNGVEFITVDRSEIATFNVAVDVADPTQCHLGFFPTDATVADGTTTMSSMQVSAAGTVSFFVPGGVEGRLGAGCATPQGWETYFYGGTDLASATVLTSPVGEAVELGSFGPNGGGLAVPDAPTGLTASASGLSVDLGWAAQNATTFDVERDGSVTAEGLASNSYSDPSLAAATTFGYRVRACNIVGCSEWSSPVSATTRPATPSNFRYTAVSTSAMTMAWDAAPAATSYELQSEAPSATVSVTGTSRTEGGLPQATTFSWRVAACNSAGCSPSTPYEAMTTGGSVTHTATSVHSSANSSSDSHNSVHPWTVPAGVRQLRFFAQGGGGAVGAVCNGQTMVGVASNAGYGGFRAATFNLEPGTAIEYYAGRLGTGRFGGWPGGGTAQPITNCTAGGAGGGRSGVRLAGSGAAFVEAGGGGGGSNRIDGSTTAGSGGNGVGGGSGAAGAGAAGSVSGVGFPLGGAGGNGPDGSPGAGGTWASACGSACSGWTYQNGLTGSGVNAAAARVWAGAGGGGTGPGGGGAAIYSSVYGTGSGGGGGGGHGRTQVGGASNASSGTAGSAGNGSVTICWHGSTACGTAPAFVP